MNVTVEQFRKEAARRRAGRSRGAAPYSSEQKAFAVDWTRAVIAKGGSYTSAARDLGVSEMTLRTYPLHEPRLLARLIAGHARVHDEDGQVGRPCRGVAREREDVGGLLLRQGLHGGCAAPLVFEAQARSGRRARCGHRGRACASARPCGSSSA